ncbi:MAG TPA: cold shock domain-containing protein [Mycobacterium sp.]|nr:cold shock domain-containing protein [Mycobacterium sp.]
MTITRPFNIESILEAMNAIDYGVIQRFNSEAGFGLITPDDGGRDLIVAVSEIGGAGPRVLEAGQRVSYRVGGTALGPHAESVHVLT